jgi:hypothetical protein
VLPRALLAHIDLGALERVPATFVDPERAKREADLLFRACLVGDPERQVLIYVLLEHQSAFCRILPSDLSRRPVSDLAH